MQQHKIVHVDASTKRGGVRRTSVAIIIICQTTINIGLPESFLCLSRLIDGFPIQARISGARFYCTVQCAACTVQCVACTDVDLGTITIRRVWSFPVYRTSYNSIKCISEGAANSHRYAVR